jgi:competence protein ComEA
MRHRAETAPGETAEFDEPGGLVQPLGNLEVSRHGELGAGHEPARGAEHAGPERHVAPEAVEAARRSRRLRAGVGGAVVLLIAAAVVGVLVSAAAQGGGSVVTPSAVASIASAPPTSATPGGGVLVHVTGAVRSPGLVSLAAGSRVVDAVAAAGGAADDADIARVNLARPVTDGEQLAVPRVGDPPPVVGATGSPAGAGGAPVNLNTATPAELETLPRIGPALAQRILDWRQANGRFTQPSDLLKVSGIGQKLFDGLKDRVVV